MDNKQTGLGDLRLGGELMARVKLIMPLAGTIGGLNFSKNASGSILRVKSGKTNRNTVSMAKNRNMFSGSNGAWHTLTDKQKALWHVHGIKTGEIGKEAFISANQNLKIFDKGLSWFDTQSIYFFGSAWSNTVLERFNNIKEPPYIESNNLSLGNSTILKFTTSGINSTGTTRFFSDEVFQFVTTDDLTTIKRLGTPMAGIAGLKFGIMIEYRLKKAQKATSRDSNDFSLFQSFPYKYRSSNLSSSDGIFITLRMPVITSYKKDFIEANVGREVELRYSLMSNFGKKYILNSEFVTIF